MSGKFYLDMTEDEYNKLDAARRSDLNILCDRSPAHYQEHITGPRKESTPQQSYGVAYHMLVLEPDALEKRCVEMLPSPVTDEGVRGWRKKADKERRDNWLKAQSAAGRIVVPEMDPKTDIRPFDELRRMRDKLWSIPFVADLIGSQGYNEVTLVWDDVTGVRCKCRIDGIRSAFDRGALFDLKSSGKGVDPDSFEESYTKLNYHRQPAFYLRGCDEVFGPAERDFYFIAQESAPPYEVMIHKAGPRSLERGHLEIDRALRLHAHCTETGNWPGYPRDIKTVELRPWRERLIDAQFEENAS